MAPSTAAAKPAIKHHSCHALRSISRMTAWQAVLMANLFARWILSHTSGRNVLDRISAYSFAAARSASTLSNSALHPSTLYRWNFV
jgi:hypothetical protein